MSKKTTRHRAPVVHQGPSGPSGCDWIAVLGMDGRLLHWHGVGGSMFNVQFIIITGGRLPIRNGVGGLATRFIQPTNSFVRPVRFRLGGFATGRAIGKTAEMKN